jgi:tetratricopeptide (TPR) repeat protein
MVAQQLQEFAEARRNYQQALEIYIEFSDHYAQASTYGALGLLAEVQEDYLEARSN